MNYNTHSNIRAAIKRAETINVRGEVSIPLYRLKEELERQRIQEQDFEQYLLQYASPLDTRTLGRVRVSHLFNSQKYE